MTNLTLATIDLGLTAREILPSTQQAFLSALNESGNTAVFANMAPEQIANFREVARLYATEATDAAQRLLRRLKAELGLIGERISAALDDLLDALSGRQPELAGAGGANITRGQEAPDVDGQVMRSQSEGTTSQGAEGSSANDLSSRVTRVPWRGTPRLLDGTRSWGWRHIEGKHITGTIPGDTSTTFFAPGTTREQIEIAINEVVSRGVRTTDDPLRPYQTFERTLIVNGRRDNIRVIIDTGDNGRVVTAFPVDR